MRQRMAFLFEEVTWSAAAKAKRSHATGPQAYIHPIARNTGTQMGTPEMPAPPRCNAHPSKSASLHDYHTTQRSAGGRTMAAPSLQLKACLNSGRLESGPITRYFPMG